ncbi:Isy1-like splicing factor [Nadsonia fulvescens var. elongata DSM 6958]|uniref:Pre-mRNA-splicing factor ISY1 n=1 Tax=Nadsonia fulvescens var. elongata DSM 6958 TaxID=857566 RepID=A0A1E3PSK2_9ASCO|nr:Isy1-like splicing factor [Nadsonia fulvescens var. elongata DSM 6958]
MSRNSEKSQSMLYRFSEQQAAEAGVIDINRTRRPRNIMEVDSVTMCEKWRGQVVRDISRKVTKIQDLALSDYQIRDLNDEINKLMREKYVWEIQLKNLGGPDYIRFNDRSKPIYDEHGRLLPSIGGRGYKYFGRARELPGVKEMLALQQTADSKNAISEKEESNPYFKINPLTITAQYFGYSGSRGIDPRLLEYETLINDDLELRTTKAADNDSITRDWNTIGKIIPPDLNQTEEYLMERKKAQLLAKYGA